MSFLLPLGFLGLLGLAILILIYIIKPNYQQKLISSTFVWKLSLKYQKKRVPISKFRNLLILICQILILTLCAFLLAKPAVKHDVAGSSAEKIIIIDASASMLASYNQETRFERAVFEAKSLAESTLDKGGEVTLILADDSADFIVERIGADKKLEVSTAFDDLLKGEGTCTYGSADIDGAIVLAESITVTNPLAEVLLFTGKKYLNSGGVTVVDVARPEEWNVAIHNVRATMDEGYYTYAVDIACYGMDKQVQVNCYIEIDEYTDPVQMGKVVKLNDDIIHTIEFKTGAADNVKDRVSEFTSVRISVQENDSFQEDNSFVLYGGMKPTLKIQYYSAKPNTFFSAAFMIVASSLNSRWDIDIDEVRGDSPAAISGYDFYVYEDKAPATLPKDGVVFLVNPSALPADVEARLSEPKTGEKFTLAPGVPHELMNFINFGNIIVSNYRAINIGGQSDFEPIIYCAGEPVFVAKNTPDSKIAIMSFSVNYSDISMQWEFPGLIYNMFEFYLPSTFTKYVFNVNESITLKARGTNLKIKGVNLEQNISETPYTMILKKVGTYTTTQDTLLMRDVRESFYVKVPDDESNIKIVIDVLQNSVIKTIVSDMFDDLLLYFAIVLVTLLFAEWWLQSRTRI